jgi:4-carboxymuconolactone decarboxylase
MAPRIEPLFPPYAEPVASDLARMMPPGVPPLRLFRTLAHNPRVLAKIRASNLLDRGEVSRRERELVILRTCARCGSEYEWGVHVAVFAHRVGLTEAEIEGTVGAGWRDPRWGERECLLLRLVDELHEGGRVGDELWQQLAARWSAAQLVELVVLVGFYHTISFVTNAFAVEPEEAGARFPGAPVPPSATC